MRPPAVIVLDDYHEVAPEAPLHEVVREAAESLPSGLSLLVLRHAPALVAQGRHRTLGQWLSGLPSALFGHAPWLCYWQGMAQLPFAPVTARGPLEEAYVQFKTSDDAVGLYSAWAGIMDTFFCGEISSPQTAGSRSSKSCSCATPSSLPQPSSCALTGPWGHCCIVSPSIPFCRPGRSAPWCC
ncbi:MAG: hypothetical protein ACREWG_11345 [Gammaproteobacteria bacterium]